MQGCGYEPKSVHKETRTKRGWPKARLQERKPAAGERVSSTFMRRKVDQYNAALFLLHKKVSNAGSMEEGLKNTLHWLNMWHMGVMWVVAICYSYFRLLLEKLSGTHARHSHQDVVETGSIRQACIITGASSGVGKATAEALALKGYYVILAGRSITRLYKVVEELELRHKNVKIKALEVDLASSCSIVKFAEAVEKLLDTCHGSISLQLLVNNAGVIATTERITAEGYESMIATNYLGHYLLTHLLLPLLQRSRVPARIVNVGSFTHRCAQSFDALLSLLHKREMQKSRGAVHQIAHVYETSKLFMIMFTYELHRRLQMGRPPMQVTAVAADPGIVQTSIFRELPRWFSSCIYMLLRSTWLLQSPAVGCKAVVEAALAPPRMSGKYFFGGQGCTISSSTLSYSSQFAADLWNLSQRLCDDVICQQKAPIQDWD